MVFISSSLLFDSAATIARVLDFRMPLLSQSLLPLEEENQLVSPQPAATAFRVWLAYCGLLSFTVCACLRYLERGTAARLGTITFWE